mgnify:CR=1 FL=1
MKIESDSTSVALENEVTVLPDVEKKSKPDNAEKKANLKDAVKKLKKITERKTCIASEPSKRFSFSSLASKYNGSLTGGEEAKKAKKLKSNNYTTCICG